MSNKTGVAICEALGIDPVDVVSIDINAGPNEPVVVTVKKHLRSPDRAKWVEVLTKFELREALPPHP